MSIASAGMELSWLYAWAVFILLPITHRPYPLPEAMAIFGLAAVLTRFPRGRGWRVIQIMGIHLSGYAAAGLRIIHVFYYGGDPFWSRWWVTDFFTASKTPLQWCVLILILGWTLSFWVGGVRLVLRSTSYSTVCSRFDLGLAIFLSK